MDESSSPNPSSSSSSSLVAIQLPSGAVERSPQGNYVKFNEILGTGSFKTVYRGQNTNAGSLIAWNEVLLKRYGQRERKRIMNEVTMLRTLSHPNLISFYGAFVKKDSKEDEKVVFITELMSSGTLKDFCNKYPIPLKQIKRYCREVLECLQYLHTPSSQPNNTSNNQISGGAAAAAAGPSTSSSTTSSAAASASNLSKKIVIHRDLKCDNIFMSTSGKGIKIGDLGLATTDGKSVMGTPEFMAPEMYESGYSTTVDIYAFGLCLLEMVTGKTPYIECTTVIQIYKNVLAGILPENTRVLEHGWPEAYRFLLRCLLPTNLYIAQHQQVSGSNTPSALSHNKHTTLASSSSSSSSSSIPGPHAVTEVTVASGSGSGNRSGVLIRSPSTSSLSSISLMSPSAIVTSSSSSSSNIVISSSSIVRSSSSSASSASASSSTTPNSSSTFSAVATTSIGSPFTAGVNNSTSDNIRISRGSHGSSGSSAESVALLAEDGTSTKASSTIAPSTTQQPSHQSSSSKGSKGRRLMRPTAAELLLDPFLLPDSNEDGNRTTRDVRETAKERGFPVIVSSTDKNRRTDLAPVTLAVAMQHQQQLEKELLIRQQAEKEEEARTMQLEKVRFHQQEQMHEEQQKKQQVEEDQKKAEAVDEQIRLETQKRQEKEQLDQSQRQQQQQRTDDVHVITLLKSQLNALQQTQQQVLLQTQQQQLQQQAHTEYLQQQSRVLMKSMEGEVSQSAQLAQLVHAQNAQIQSLLSSQQRAFEEIAVIRNSTESTKLVVEWIAKAIRSSSSSGGASGGTSGGASGGGGGIGSLLTTVNGGGGNSPSSNSPNSSDFQIPSSSNTSSSSSLSSSSSSSVGVSIQTPHSPPNSSLPSPSQNGGLSSHSSSINDITHAAFFSPSLPNGSSLLPIFSPQLPSSSSSSSATSASSMSTGSTSSSMMQSSPESGPDQLLDGGSSSILSASSSSTSVIGGGGGGKKLKSKSVSFATSESSVSSTSASFNGTENQTSDNTVLNQGGVSPLYDDASSNFGLANNINHHHHHHNRQGGDLIGLTSKISIEDLSKLSDDDVFVDSSIVDIDELTGEQVIEEMQSHLHQLRLRQFMSEIRQARISSKQLAEIATAKSELSAEFEETLQIESARHNEELIKMDKQRQELLEKVTPIRQKIAAASSAAAASATAASTSVTDSTSSADSSLDSTVSDEKPTVSTISATVITDVMHDASPPSPPLLSSSSSTTGGGGGGAISGGGSVGGGEGSSSFSSSSSSSSSSSFMSSSSAATSATATGDLSLSSSSDYSSGSSYLEITVRERHEEVLYSRRLDLLDQRQKDELQRNTDHLKEAQENFDVKSRRLVLREKEVREAFSTRVEKGRSELMLQIQMVCNRDTTPSSSTAFMITESEMNHQATTTAAAATVAWADAPVSSDSHPYSSSVTLVAATGEDENASEE